MEIGHAFWTTVEGLQSSTRIHLPWQYLTSTWTALGQVQVVVVLLPVEATQTRLLGLTL